MNLIQKTCLSISKYQSFIGGAIKDVNNLIVQNARVVPSTTYEYIDQQTRHLGTERHSPMSQNRISYNLTGVRKDLLKGCRLHLADCSMPQVQKRTMSSGLGPNWPSRLGKIKTKRATQLRGSIDVLEDNNEENINTKEIVDKVNNQIAEHSYGRLFAIVLMEKHQHKITSGDLLMCNHDIGASLGQVIRLDKSLLIGGKDFTLIGRPLLPRDSFRIVATVVEKNLSQHKINFLFKKRVKANNPKTRWSRDFTTTLRINSIELIKPVDKTIDRVGFEPPLNKTPLNGL